jgi:hypothetical protein
VFSYSIPTANTWTQISVTIPGCPDGTWLTNSGSGAYVAFSLGMGSNYTTTAGSWNSSAKFSVTGGVNVVGTSGATFYLTGVQFEVGTTATNFDFRSIGTEDFLCRRYYQSLYGNEMFLTSYDSNTSTRVAGNFTLPVNMRIAPTMSYTTSALGSLVSGNVLTNWVSYIYNGSSGRAGNTELINMTANAEL